MADRLKNYSISKVWRRSNLASNAFELWIALAGVLTGLTFLINPEALADSSIGRRAGLYAYGWNSLYLVGAVLVVYGLWNMRSKIEIAGLSLLGAAAAINAFAVIIVRGTGGIGTMLTYLSFTVAASIRSYYVRRVQELNE